LPIRLRHRNRAVRVPCARGRSIPGRVADSQ